MTGDRTDQPDRTRSWSRRIIPSTNPQPVTPPAWATPAPGPDHGHASGSGRALHAVPDPRPAPEREKSAARTPGAHPRSLTDEEIFYFVRRDPGIFFEEDFWHEVVQFDRAIDREPEIE